MDKTEMAQDPRRFVDWFWRSPAGQKAIQEEEDDRTRQRREGAARIQEIEKEAAATIPGLIAARDKARARAAKAFVAWREAKHAYNYATAVTTGASAMFDQRIGTERLELRRLADDETIDAFIKEMRALHQDCGRLFTSEEDDEKTFNRNTGAYERSVRSNWVPVQARARRILEVIREAENLKEQSVEDLPAKLQALRDSISPADIFV